MAPPRASISRTRWPLAMPPMAGLHDICAIRSAFIVTIAVFSSIRAHARAASHPACPAPMITTSYFSCIGSIVRLGLDDKGIGDRQWRERARAVLEAGAVAGGGVVREPGQSGDGA